MVPRESPSRQLLVAACLATGPLAAHAGGAGHVGMILSGDDYSSEYFEAGRENDRMAWSTGLTAKYLWADDAGRWPTLGASIGQWDHQIKGDCCGFEDERIEATVRAADLLWGNLSSLADGSHEAWYVLAGVASLDSAASFDTAAAASIGQEREQGTNFGVGLVAGEKGGFSGSFELRYMDFEDFEITHYALSVGLGF